LRIVCGKCAAEVELPKEGDSPEVRCPSCAAIFYMPSLAEGESLLHPDTFPGYRIVAIVGHGGMGTVYRAIQLSMEREVAIKVLLRKYSQVPRFVARFGREASALAVLSHANIVGVIDRGRIEDMYYFIMEYVHGRTLRYFIKNNLLSVERCIDIAVQTCQALDAAHVCGIIHRDIKPGNILIREDGTVKVADFGIAHMIEEVGDAAERERRSRLGTARYMAPEQHGTGEPIDPRADVYALGITLFEMLTGTLPRGEPASRLNRLVPPGLDLIVERATRELREERFGSAAEFREALTTVRASLSLEETPTTGLAAAPGLAAARCRACGQGVGAADTACPHCGAALYEPCYRAECQALNPAGAERCASCGGHMELLRRHRRAELEALLEQARVLAAGGRADDAIRELEAVAAAPHEAFRDLREHAQGELARLRHERLARHAGRLVAAVAALLLVGAVGGALYLGYMALAPRARAKIPEVQPKPDTTRKAATSLPAAKVPPIPEPPPEPVARRTPFADYLLALTGPGWAKHAPAVRLSVACDAGNVLLASKPRGRLAEALAKSLADAEQGKGSPPDPNALQERLARLMDGFCDLVSAQIPRPPQPAKEGDRSSRRPKGRPTLPDPHPSLDGTVAALEEMLTAEATSAGVDTPTRLLLLDASVASAFPVSATRQTADRLIRVGRLLVRRLYGQKDPRVAQELLDDAGQRLDLAQREPNESARLALSVEAVVEALGSKW